MPRIALTGGDYTARSFLASVPTAMATPPSVASPPGVQIGGDVSANTAVTSGGTASRTIASHIADYGINPVDFGAKGDGVTDDSAAINAATSYGRTLGFPFKIIFPPGRTFVVQANGINWTEITLRGFSVDGMGSEILCRTTGKACIDMMGSNWTQLSNLLVVGDGNYLPTVGIQIGRTTGGAFNNSWNHINVYGSFSFAAMYQLSTETSNFTDLRLTNNYGGGSYNTCFALVQDGVNHWQPASQYTKVAVAADTYYSFNEDLYLQAHLTAAYGCTPLWTANTRRHSWIGSYIADGTGTAGTLPASSPYGVILFSDSSSDKTDMLDMDTHFETGSMQDEFFITGPNPTPTLNGFKRREQLSNATSAIFKVDTTTVAGVTMNDADLDFSGLGGVVFADPALWTVTGRFSLPSGSAAWNLPASQFNGVGTIGSSTSFFGNGQALTLSSSQITLPTNLQVASLYNTGGLNSVSFSGTTPYDIGGWCSTNHAGCNSSLAGRFPTVTVGPPPSGESQATVTISQMAFTGEDGAYTSGSAPYLPYSGGAGCSANDVLTMQGGTYTTAMKMVVTSVDPNGAVTGWKAGSIGAYSAIPADPQTVTGGTCTTEPTFAGLTWKVSGVTFTAGAGYSSVPPMTVQTSSIGSNSSTQLAGTLTSAMSLSAGAGSITLNTNGVTTSGPETHSGAETHSGQATFAALNQWSALDAIVPASITSPASGAAPSGATQLTKRINRVTTCSTTQPIQLPAGGAAGVGLEIFIINDATTACPVYPPSAGQINSAGANVADSLAAGARAYFVSESASAWFQ